jgi:Ca2+-binding EF-hand superfamily protein
MPTQTSGDNVSDVSTARNRMKRLSADTAPVKLGNMAPDIKQSWSTVEQFKMQQEIKNNQKKNRRRSTIGDYLNTKNKMKLTEDFSDIYFFSSPLIYFRAVEVAIMLNSLYLSMWAVNFISVAKDETENPVVWQLLMLTPLVVCVPLVGAIVKAASLLSAIAELEVDVIGSVLENMEDETVLLQELREKIARRLEHVNVQAEKKDIVNALFYEIDTDRSGYISRHEFRDMLRALHLHYSDHKFKKLFNVIDKDRSGAISEKELTDVVFPDEALNDDVKNRSKIVNDHIAKKKDQELEKNQKVSNTKRRWGRISNLTKSIGQFKSNMLARRLNSRRNVVIGGGQTNSSVLSDANLQRLREVAAAPRGARASDDSDSSSSSSSKLTPGRSSAKVGVLESTQDSDNDNKDYAPKKGLPKQKSTFLNVLDNEEIVEEKESDETSRRGDISLQQADSMLGRSMDDVEQLEIERGASSNTPNGYHTIVRHDDDTTIQDFSMSL